MQAFITGSRRYGTPGQDSDIDLVVRCDDDTANMLFDLSDQEGSCQTIRFGLLNLIVCTSDSTFAKWKQGTEELAAKAPVTREEAVATFKRLRV